MWGCYCIVNKVVQGAMRAQIVKYAGFLIWTQLWSTGADHKKMSTSDFGLYIKQI